MARAILRASHALALCFQETCVDQLTLRVRRNGAWFWAAKAAFKSLQSAFKPRLEIYARCADRCPLRHNVLKASEYYRKGKTERLDIPVECDLAVHKGAVIINQCFANLARFETMLGDFLDGGNLCG